MRAGMYAVQTEGAIHVARLTRLEKLQLTAAMLFIAAKTVMRFAVTANFEVADCHFYGRNQRLNELILPNRTNVLTKTRSLKETVNDDRGREIAQHHPGGPARTVPQAEGFIGPKEGQEKGDGDPF